MTVSYHPDPEINAEVVRDAADAERSDVRSGYPPRRWMCPDCGASHERGFFPLGTDAHRCLRCGYLGVGGVLWDPKTEPDPAFAGPGNEEILQLHEELIPSTVAADRLLLHLCDVALGRFCIVDGSVMDAGGIRNPTHDERAMARRRIAVRCADHRRTQARNAVAVNGVMGERAYLALLRQILDHGSRRTDRTGTGTMSIFGAQLRFDLREGFPLLTTKKVAFQPIVRELLWFLRGSTNVRELGARIWDEWADENGDLGPIYGHQFRRWGQGVPRGARVVARSTGDFTIEEDVSPGIDQITEAIRTVRTNPDSRRIIVSAWNVADLPQMRLPPCHLLFQLYVDDGHLDLQLYQRSADMALGVPFNIASYALLLSMIARECRLVPRYFVHTFGDAHVYLNHVDGIREQLTRDPMLPPRLVLAEKAVLEQTEGDIELEGYQHHPAIKFQVSV